MLLSLNGKKNKQTKPKTALQNCLENHSNKCAKKHVWDTVASIEIFFKKEIRSIYINQGMVIIPIYLFYKLLVHCGKSYLNIKTHSILSFIPLKNLHYVHFCKEIFININTQKGFRAYTVRIDRNGYLDRTGWQLNVLVK